MQCSACGSYDHFRKDYHQDNFCTRCRLKSHATHMCRAPVRINICIYCSSTQHSSGNGTIQPNDNREEPRSAPWDLHSQGTLLQSRHQIFRTTMRKSRKFYQIQDRHIQVHHCLTETTDMNMIGPDVNKQGLTKGTTGSIHQIIIINHLLHVSVAGPDLSATLIDLANIQSR